jgi:hypothetical protein
MRENVQDEAIYRCINPACARPMPRRVNFCPWCGSAQDAAARAQELQRERAVPAAPPAPVELPAPPTPVPPPARPTPPPPAPKPAPAAPSPHAFGHSGTAAAAGAFPPRPGVTGGPSRPRQRQPIRLRWWILALAILWVVWLVARPSAKETERHIEAAIFLAHACQEQEAQDELIALRASRATPAQLESVQKVLNEEAARCTRQRRKDKTRP